MSTSTSTRISIAASCMMLTLVLAFAPIIPGATKPAHAQLATFETNPALLLGVGVTAESTGFNAHVKPILDGIAWAVAKAAIQAVTKSMVNWINSGFQGSPAFVTNLNENLLQVGDAVADNFFDALQKNTGVNVRSPFQDQISQALRTNYYRTTGNNAYFNTGYTLNQRSSDPAAFLQGKFQQNGGFDAWFDAVTNDQNNPYGAFRAAQDELRGRIQSKQAGRLSELNWGKGFLSWRGDCKVPNPTALGKEDTCLEYDIKTPGSIVESSLGITVTSPLRQLELADSVNEIVAALASQLVNQVIGGVGLSGLTSAPSGGGRSALDQATDPSLYQSGATASAGFAQTIATDQQNAQTYKTNWEKIQTLAQATVVKCTNLNDANSTILQNALTRASTAVTKATTAVTQLATISQLLSSSDSSAATTASTQYQTLISSGSIPTAQDVADSAAQSSPAESGSTSLYTTLTNMNNSCGVAR